MVSRYSRVLASAASTLLAGAAFIPQLEHLAANDGTVVAASLSEWKIQLSQARVGRGSVKFTVTNSGSIPHALEVEGQGIEQQTALIQPGTSATLILTLSPGEYEIYCPVGEDSHKKLGMSTHLTVTDEKTSDPPVQKISVKGGGPVIQILPGPFPFSDSLGPVLPAFGKEREMLESQAKNGPYSNNVTPIAGNFRFTAWDKGGVRDSISGVAEFTTKDAARWRLLLDRVQTEDVPHHPRFGGVILGLY
jgi:plastocyanin